ncbi:hypothetical protein SBOR_7858 [Sclerotinia borealis F-4128]|uniref:Xylanolytic transcriptional activator regulatory domain-containing protein n=1 Tax=Sclerotinia borealis (strain F-4128) TaxID=1432307 RepID=W9C7B9_SCLBF|nr:hypothetical protein SBOR_7858 [Sclerotinia borealis F-4128]
MTDTKSHDEHFLSSLSGNKSAGGEGLLCRLNHPLLISRADPQSVTVEDPSRAQLVERRQGPVNGQNHHVLIEPASEKYRDSKFGGPNTFGNTIVKQLNYIVTNEPVIGTKVLHKTRLLGQSHWINGVTGYYDLSEILEPYIQEGSKAAAGIYRCKTLGKLIKTRRAPLWPSPPTWPDLPSREIADILVDCYFRTIEIIYRVLHISTFINNYEAIWTSTRKPDIEFLVQLKLIFAIGTATYDDQFSLRASAVRWVYEAQTWISESEFKSRLTIKSLQTELLLLFARETVGIGGRLIWTSAGTLFRTAVYMGLHRDPATLPKRTIFAAEMRRRL